MAAASSSQDQEDTTMEGTGGDNAGNPIHHPSFRCAIESNSPTRRNEHWEVFRAGVQVILSKWDLMKMAVEDQWGGPQSWQTYDSVVEDLIQNIVEQWNEDNDLFRESMEDFFLDVLETDFNCDVEDEGVVAPVCEHIQKIYRKCAKGDTKETQEMVEEFIKNNPNGVLGSGRRQQTTVRHNPAEDAPSSDSDDDDDEAKMPGASGEPDEDGWVTVKRK